MAHPDEEAMAEDPQNPPLGEDSPVFFLGEVEEERGEGEENSLESKEEILDSEGRVARLAQILESLLFVSDHPLTLGQMKKVLEEGDHEYAASALRKLKMDYAQGRGVQLVEVAGGFQLRTTPENAPWIKKMVSLRPVRLSQAGLEVLAVIAYRQPITRAAVEQIRGVDCSGVLKTLFERELIKTFGKAEEPGKPTLYGTSKHFLEVFGLKSLGELPALSEFQELSPEEAAHLYTLGQTPAQGEGEEGSEEDLLGGT
jgi:segregation and condensation protein B